jgi:hypothetical protein
MGSIKSTIKRFVPRPILSAYNKRISLAHQAPASGAEARARPVQSPAKKKRKLSKPLNPKDVFDVACKFAAAEQHLRHFKNPHAHYMASASMVLSAFAIELFLKCGKAQLAVLSG